MIIVHAEREEKMICDKCIDKEICDGRCFHYKERMEVKEGVVIVVNGGQVCNVWRDDTGGELGVSEVSESVSEDL